MQSATQLASTSKAGLWAGRIISTLVVLFLLFDAGIKLLNLGPAVEGTVKLGYPASVVVPLGMVLLACVLLYVIPRTAILGAILLTGFLGGATATNVRVQNPWILFPVGIGVLAWGGLYLRDEHLRSLIPLRKA
jgi:hypothetical protein